MGASDYVLSCLALNDYDVGGRRLSCPSLGIRDFHVRLPESRACAKLGHKVELCWADRWRDLVRLRLVRVVPWFSSF
jgi:hypothetical protein